MQFLTVSHFVYNFISYHVEWHVCRHDRLLAHDFFYEGQICYVPVTYTCTFEIKTFWDFLCSMETLVLFSFARIVIRIISIIDTLQSCSSFLYMTIFLKLCIFCPNLKLIEMIHTIVINLFIQILLLPACHS